jgi:hypothetical protein
VILDCTWPICQDLLPAAIAGTLVPAEQARVTAHLASCAACRQAAAQWRQVAVLARQADGAAARFEGMGAAGTLATIQARIVAESPFEGEALSMDTKDSTTTGQHTSSPQKASGRRRTGASVAAISAVVLVALAATIFALHGRPTSASPGTSSKTTTSQTQTTSQTNRPTPTPIPLPPYPQTQDPASIVSATNVWQVASGINKDGQDEAFINHFDGQTWHQEFSANITILLGISMDSADDGWAVGSGNVSNSPNPTVTTPLVLHYTHGQWVQVNTIASGFDPQGVQMLNADDGWMFGDTTSGSGLYHFTGSQWNAVPFAPHTSATALTAMPQPESALDNPNPNLPIITQLHMVSDTEGWGLGLWHGAEVIWHDHNGTWTAELPVTVGSNAGYVSIGVNAANDVWVLGAYAPGNAAFGMPANQPSTTLHQPQSAGPEELHHFDGSRWQTIQLPSGVNNYPIGNFVGDGNWILVYGGSGTVLGLLHHTGGQWSLTTLPGTFTAVTDLAQQADGSALAVALQSGVPGGAVILRYANGAWTQIG